jgi:hypothetical protein
LARCQRELRKVLSDWLALRLRMGLEIPTLGGVNLNYIGVVTRA